MLTKKRCKKVLCFVANMFRFNFYTEIYIKDLPFKENEFRFLAKKLPLYIESIRIENCPLNTIQDVLDFSKYAALKTVCISNSYFHSIILMIIESLPFYLEHLDVSKNCINPNQLIKICEDLDRFEKLRHLNISHINFTKRYCKNNERLFSEVISIKK